MNKLFTLITLVAIIVFLLTACGTQAMDVPPEEPAAVPVELIPVTALTYDALLDKSLTDQSVADFIAGNDCHSAKQVQICQSAGMALWTDADQKVQSIYLYSGNTDGFVPYQGQLPAGLAFADSMEAVEQKLGHPVEIHAPQAGWVPGLPDESVTPDHFHYQAIYRRFGLTVIYNSPSASDKSATINAIVVTK